MAGRALRALRLRANLKQEELASRAHTHANYISSIENGHRGLRWQTILRLLRAMDTTAGDFGAEVDEQERLSRTEAPAPRKGLRG